MRTRTTMTMMVMTTDQYYFRNSPATDYLICTIDNGFLQLENGLNHQHTFKTFLGIFMIIPRNRLDEVVDLITIGMSSYNFRKHVASDIPVHGQYVDPKNLIKQKYISTLDTWSNNHRIKPNKKKPKLC